MMVVPPNDTEVNGDTHSLFVAGNAFCALISKNPNGCKACMETRLRLNQKSGNKLVPQQMNCFAGLTDLAVPVTVTGKHVATVISGQVFRREPTERDFQMVLKMLGDGFNRDWEKRVHDAYFETQVVTAERFEGIIQLLDVSAHYLASQAALLAIAESRSEPRAVANAKQFVQSHSEEPITLTQVVKHVHVNRFYFCKLFKKATGITFTDYVIRVRVEKAKALLVDPSMRISEVVFAAGFGSIPRFNSVFKRYVGMPPTEYREVALTDIGLNKRQRISGENHPIGKQQKPIGK